MIDSDFVAYFQIDLIQELFANAKEDYGHPEDQIADILPGLSPIPFKDLPHEIILKNQSNPDPVVPLLSSRVKKLPQASAVLLNSYEELNPTLLTNYLKSNLQNVLYVGSLTQSPPAFGADATVAELRISKVFLFELEYIVSYNVLTKVFKCPKRPSKKMRRVPKERTEEEDSAPLMVDTICSLEPWRSKS
ncbi:hypothetical protein GH714_002786 [Hevea brasiliensis]|uniref:Uncharacterized protein n=1 Tax=Hevea brasiliensis TaxID=3981 RepID=A0A6A6KYD7_HEVBR|nr:hypothetical protein GH714_002786 [Hevea brasiliensis]